MLRALRDKVELFKLGQSVDKPADIAAEKLVDVLARRFGVFDRIVQDRRDDCCVVDLHVGKNGSDFEGMRKIWIAGSALLRSMSFIA